MEAPDSAAAPEAGAAETSQIDFSPVLDRFEELAGQVGGLNDRFTEHFQPQQEPEERDPWADLYGEPEEPEPEQAPALNVDALREALNSQVSQAVGPLQQQLAQMQAANDLASLRTDFPELADPAVAKATGEYARQMAEGILASQGYDRELASVLTNSKDFISLAHRAMAAERNAAGEVPAGGEQHQLEPGGSVPAGQEEQPSIVAQVMASRRSLPRGLA